jgi:hypothetical protein
MGDINEYKETLKKRLLNEIDAIDRKCEQLNKNINEYKENNNFEDAMKSDIRWRQLKIISQRLKKLMV